MSDTQKGNLPRQPPLPPLPTDLQPISDHTIPVPCEVAPLIVCFDIHARELIDFVSTLELWVTDKTNARKSTKEKEVKNRPDRSGWRREFLSALDSSGLRHRIYVLLELCKQLEVPPTHNLLTLIRRLDGPEIMPGYLNFLTQDHRVNWHLAIGMYVASKRQGKEIPKAQLARQLQIPLSTLRDWMRRPEWAETVTNWLQPAPQRTLWVGKERDFSRAVPAIRRTRSEN